MSMAQEAQILAFEIMCYLLHGRLVVLGGDAIPSVPSIILYDTDRMTSDETLVTSYMEGDSDAFTELYERYVKRIYDFVYFKTHHKQTAEDIVSQTFLRMIEKIDTFNPKKGNFSAWLHSVARNLVIDHFRAAKPTSSIDDAWDLTDGTNVVADADTKVKVEAVREVLSKLNGKQREVILLRLWHGYAFKEVAEIIGSTEAACKMQYKRGMENVRKDLVIVLLLLFFSS